MTSIRKMYDTFGVDNYYLTHQKEYVNPHEKFVRSCLDNLWNASWNSVLDFACGSGLITEHLLCKYKDINILGCDKYMADVYNANVNKKCFPYSFEDVALNKIPDFPQIDVVVISYALDLIPPSYESNFLYVLSLYAKNLIVIRPNSKRVEPVFWKEVKACKVEKSKAVLYKSVG